MIDDLIKKYDGSNKMYQNLSIALDKISAEELLNIYFKYVKLDYSVEYTNISKSLELIKSIIIKKIGNLSFLELIDFYANLYIECSNKISELNNSKNFINNRVELLNNKDSLIREAKNRNRSIESFNLSNPERNLELLDELILDVTYFKKIIYDYLKLKLENMTEQEEIMIALQLKEKINSNDVEINKRKELLSNNSKINVMSRFLYISPSTLRQDLDPKELEIKNQEVYEPILNNLTMVKSKK